MSKNVINGRRVQWFAPRQPGHLETPWSEAEKVPATIKPKHLREVDENGPAPAA